MGKRQQGREPAPRAEAAPAAGDDPGMRDLFAARDREYAAGAERERERVQAQARYDRHQAEMRQAAEAQARGFHPGAPIAARPPSEPGSEVRQAVAQFPGRTDEVRAREAARAAGKRKGKRGGGRRAQTR
jgi:hypothetical protein